MAGFAYAGGTGDDEVGLFPRHFGMGDCRMRNTDGC